MEPVEWGYDGLGGKIIKWTMDSGSPSDHPSILAFFVGVDGTVESMLDGGKQYGVGSFCKWLEEQVKAYEKAHPKTRLPFVLTDVMEADGSYTCKAASDAHEAGQRVLLFFGRERFDPKDKPAKKEAKLTRSFAKKVLNAQAAEKQKEGFVFLRFDVSDEAHAAYAKQLGPEQIPALFMWLPGESAPTDLGKRISGSGLAQAMKKSREPKGG